MWPKTEETAALLGHRQHHAGLGRQLPPLQERPRESFLGSLRVSRARFGRLEGCGFKKQRTHTIREDFPNVCECASVLRAGSLLRAD